MKSVKIINKTKNSLITSNGKMADTFGTRYKGLLGRISIADDFCMVLVPCNQIHMFFMKFSIDVVYLDKGNKICAIDFEMKPWQVGKKKKEAQKVLEFKAGFVDRKMNVNDILIFEDHEVVI